MAADEANAERRDPGFVRALHLEIADFLLAHPELADRAREQLGTVEVKATRRRWRTLLDRPVDEIADALRSRRLRGVLHASPFVNALSAAELQTLADQAVKRLAHQDEGRRTRRHGRTKAESKLAALRIEQGFTQAQMAEMTGIAPQTYWKLERLQLQNPPVGYLAACARVLQVSIEEVVEDELLQWGVRPERPKR